MKQEKPPVRSGPKPQPRWAPYMDEPWFSTFKKACEKIGTEGVAARMELSNSTVRNVLFSYGSYASPRADASKFALAFEYEFEMKGNASSPSHELRALRRLSMGDAVAFAMAHPDIRKKMDELLALLDAEVTKKRREEVAALRSSGEL